MLFYRETASQGTVCRTAEKRRWRNIPCFVGKDLWACMDRLHGKPMARIDFCLHALQGRACRQKSRVTGSKVSGSSAKVSTGGLASHRPWIQISRAGFRIFIDRNGSHVTFLLTHSEKRCKLPYRFLPVFGCRCTHHQGSVR